MQPARNSFFIALPESRLVYIDHTGRCFGEDIVHVPGDRVVQAKLTDVDLGTDSTPSDPILHVPLRLIHAGAPEAAGSVPTRRDLALLQSFARRATDRWGHRRSFHIDEALADGTPFAVSLLHNSEQSLERSNVPRPLLSTLTVGGNAISY